MTLPPTRVASTANRRRPTTDRRRAARRRVPFAILALLSTGTLFGTCEMRLRDSVTSASRNTIVQVLIPAAFSQFFPGLSSTTGATTSTPSFP